MEFQTISFKLLEATSKIANILQQIKEINSITRLISINAAIESSRSAQLSDSFSNLSEQVRTLSTRSEESFHEIHTLIGKLRKNCARAVAVRLTDIAVDTIDKIDRNLFERNCDVQAWASFKVNVMACKEGGIYTKQATKLIQNLVNVYEVYHDILLLNKKGIVIASAKNPQLVGGDQSNRTWFRKVISQNKTYVTDMYISRSIKNYTISYSAPVRDETGEVIGVISTRFNWDYIYDILEKIKLDHQCKVFLVSSEGIVLASKLKLDVLKDNLLWLAAGEQAVLGKTGYSIECARNGQWKAFGFSRTKGYNSYSGKGWSVIVEEPIDLEESKVMIESFTENSKENKSRAYSEQVNHSLLQITHQLSEAIASINRINNVTTTLALNAAIRADRSGTEGRAFSVLAEEIRAFSSKSDQLTEEINTTLDSLKHIVQETVSRRLADAAFDTIDKVERNLFERHCDVQAWTIFEDIVLSVESGNGDKAQALLKELHQIYEVYHDIYLLDSRGKICACAIRHELVGQDQSGREWFQQAIQGNVYHSNLYKSETTGTPTVAFSAPVKNKDGKIIGVLTTRFNWNYVLEIVNSAVVYSDCKVYLLNSDGIVIASSTGTGDILKKDFSRFEAFKLASRGSNGFIEERDPTTNNIYLIGYAMTEGYNKYRGKGWIVLIIQDKGV